MGENISIFTYVQEEQTSGSPILATHHCDEKNGVHFRPLFVWFFLGEEIDFASIPFWTSPRRQKNLSGIILDYVLLVGRAIAYVGGKNSLNLVKW